MKNYILLLVCIACVGYVSFINAQRKYLQSGMNIKVAADSFHYTDAYKQHSFDSIQMLAIKQLLKTENYDSVIQYCNYFRSKDSIDFNTYELATAAAYWPFGERPKTYDIVLKNVQYNLSLHAGGGNPFQMIYDYGIGLNLADDKLLEDMVTEKVLNYYSSMNNPETSAGLKLIRLQYQSKKLIAKCDYMQSLIDPAYNKTAIARRYASSVQQQFEEGQSEIFNELKELIQNNHQKLFTNYQVGTVHPNQMAIIEAFQNPVEYDYFNEILRNSLADKSLSADAYVDYSVNGMSMKQKGMSEATIKNIKDSLCKIYKCTESKTTMILYDKVISQHYDSTGTLYYDTIFIDRKKKE